MKTLSKIMTLLIVLPLFANAPLIARGVERHPATMHKPALKTAHPNMHAHPVQRQQAFNRGLEEGAAAGSAATGAEAVPVQPVQENADVNQIYQQNTQ